MAVHAAARVSAPPSVRSGQSMTYEIPCVVTRVGIGFALLRVERAAQTSALKWRRCDGQEIRFRRESGRCCPTDLLCARSSRRTTPEPQGSPDLELRLRAGSATAAPRHERQLHASAARRRSVDPRASAQNVKTRLLATRCVLAVTPSRRVRTADFESRGSAGPFGAGPSSHPRIGTRSRPSALS